MKACCETKGSVEASTRKGPMVRMSGGIATHPRFSLWLHKCVCCLSDCRTWHASSCHEPASDCRHTARMLRPFGILKPCTGCITRGEESCDVKLDSCIRIFRLMRKMAVDMWKNPGKSYKPLDKELQNMDPDFCGRLLQSWIARPLGNVWGKRCGHSHGHCGDIL